MNKLILILKAVHEALIVLFMLEFERFDWVKAILIFEKIFGESLGCC
jgi:hypothetical protein